MARRSLIRIALTGLFGLVSSCLVVGGMGVSGAPVPERGVDFDLEAIRILAGATGPRTLRTVEVTSGSQLGLFLRAGGDFDHHDMPVYPVELEWASGKTVLLEPATDPVCSEPHLPVLRFDAAAYERMQQAMLRADAIVATHEHFDHLCGLTQSPHLEALADRALLTPEQLDGTAAMTGVDERTRALVKPFPLPGPTALAPGVVLLPVGGHSPGSLWVYVRTEAGREWLFVGDTVWTREALELGRPKPRMIAWVGGEDEVLQGRLLRTLLDLQETHPEVGVLVSHDAETWQSLLADGTFERL